MVWAVTGMVAVVVGVSAVVSGGLTWTGAVGALLVALYASAVVVAAIAFYATYRRHNPEPPAFPRVIEPQAHQAAPIPEPADEPVAAPLPPAHEERPAP